MNNTDIKKIITIGAGLIPIITFLGTLALWADTRYMHRDISDSRFVDIQISVTQGHLRDFERMGERNESEQREYEAEKQRLDFLVKERNKLLGIGDNNE